MSYIVIQTLNEAANESYLFKRLLYTTLEQHDKNDKFIIRFGSTFNQNVIDL